MDDLELFSDLLLPTDLDLDGAAPDQEADNIEEKLITENIETAVKLDYTLKTCEERAEWVERIIARTP